MMNSDTLIMGGTVPAFFKLHVLREEFVVVPVDDLDQAWFWTKEWQQKEAEAENALRVGRFKVFDSVDDMIAFLDSDEE